MQQVEARSSKHKHTSSSSSSQQLSPTDLPPVHHVYLNSEDTAVGICVKMSNSSTAKSSQLTQQLSSSAPATVSPELASTDPPTNIDMSVAATAPMAQMADDKSVGTIYSSTTYNTGRGSQEIRSRLLSRLGIYDPTALSSSPPQSQPMTAAQHRRVRILRGMGVG